MCAQYDMLSDIDNLCTCGCREFGEDDQDGFFVSQAFGNCHVCGGLIDENGDTCEPDNCSYSPVECQHCNHQPCDGSC